MSKNKGAASVPGLLMFALIVVITISVVYIASLIPLVNQVVGLKADVRFGVMQDDRGTALVTFLNMEKRPGLSYAEIMGNQAAKGVDTKLDDEMEDTIKKIGPETGIAIYNSSGEIKKYGSKVGDVYLSADIAFPGVTKGEVRVV